MEGATLIFIAVMVLMGGWYWHQKKKEEEMERKKGVPKGSLGWPIIGETLEFISCGFSSTPVTFMNKRKSLYGKLFKTNILGKPIIISTDPEVNKIVMQNHGHNFIPAYPKSTMELFGENSIVRTNGHLQKKLHSVIGGYLRSPQFKARITKDIERSVKLNLASWKHMDLVLVQDETKKVTFEVLVKSLMSIGPGEELDFIKREFVECVKAIISLPIKLPGTRLYKSLKAKEKLLKLVRKIVEERKLAMERSSSGEPVDAIDVLLRDRDEASGNPSVPLDIISGNIFEMMIPGEETVPTAMTVAVKLLTDNPLALQRLTEENMELKRQKADSCHDYTWADYMSLPFTQSVHARHYTHDEFYCGWIWTCPLGGDVISETLRLANIINGVWRKTLKDVEIKGHFIPKGWCVMTAFVAVHMNEEIYENPYQFDPWRWEKTAAAVNNNCFTPFGGGQRLCPGLELSRLEIAIFLHHLVTTYSWTAEKDEIVYFPTVKMKRKLPITVTSQTSKMGLNVDTD